MEDDPFDFESDSLLATSSSLAPKRRKKVIGLDDLLSDYYKEKSKIIERESKRAKTKKVYNSDDDAEDGRVAKLSKYVDECHEKMTQLSDEDDISVWGLQVFGNQKALPSFEINELSSCELLTSFLNQELNSLLELSTETGETFFEGLLTDGWLLKLVRARGKVENFVAKWTFHLMLYSSKEVLRTAACDFWCAILLLKNEGRSLPVKIDWLPSFPELKAALETYGYLVDSPIKYSPDAEIAHGDSEVVGPPQNIRAWIKFVAVCGQAREMHSIFSASEAEELMVVIICLLLDRQLLGLSVILHECMLALVDFFSVEEWSSSCERVAMSVASRVPLDINCLRAVESISAVCVRTKLLRSATAFQILLGCFSDKFDDEEEIIRQLTLINLKDKSCDLSRIYIYLVLTENWLLLNHVLREKPLLNEMWTLFLRNCSCQINITETRSYASKVRSKASYLLQGMTSE